MQTSRRFTILIAVMMLFAATLALTGTATATNHNGTYTLYAGQDIPVGEVTVTNDAEYLYVTYVIDEPWCMTESHLAVATTLGGIPQRNGNPVPGRFPYKTDHDPCVTTYTYKIAMTLGLDDLLYIAAHAVVETTGSETIVSGAGLGITANDEPAVAAIEPGVGVPFPNCPAGDKDAIPSLWDNNVKKLGEGVFIDWDGADWIWSSGYPYETAMTGEYVNFLVDFELPGEPVVATLTAAGDNAYAVTVNDVPMGKSHTAGPKFGTELKEDVGLGAQVGDWGVAGQGWQLVEDFDITGLTEGTNTLEILAANEYLAPDDSHLNWNNTSQTYGTEAKDAASDRCNNPAGLIFKLEVDWLRSETAWGDGEDFSGANWATYFTYTVQGELDPEPWPAAGTVSVAYEDLPLTGGNDWDYNDFVVDIDIDVVPWGTSEEWDHITEITFATTPQVKLAGYTHVMHLAQAFGCDGTYDLNVGVTTSSGLYDDSAGLDAVMVPNTGSFVNSTLTITFDDPCPFAFPVDEPGTVDGTYHGENLFFDPYIKVNNTGQEIHRGDARMLVVPIDWSWPTPDGTAIWNVYSKVTAGNPPTFSPYWWTTP